MMKFLQRITFLIASVQNILIGGQAVMEGVMLTDRKHMVTAVRTPQGKIKTIVTKTPSILDKFPLFKLPFLRGMIGLIETLIWGLKSLHISSNIALEEENEKLSNWELILTLVFSLCFAIVLFKFLPLLGANLIRPLVGESNILYNAVNGALKLIIFIGYISLIGLMKDVKELFRYHSAEHMVVNCYEAGDKLNVLQVAKHTRKQPRCGTTFMLFVLLVSIVFYIFVIPISLTFWLKLLLQIALLPLIAGVSYEIIRLAGKYYKNRIARIIIAPGMFVQKLTTRTPEKKHLEVGLRAIKKLLLLQKTRKF